MSSDGQGTRRSKRARTASKQPTRSDKLDSASLAAIDNDKSIKPADDTNNVVIDEDDICPICQLLFYEPVITHCGHSLCKTCMTQWAEVSTTSRLAAVNIDEDIPELRSNKSSLTTHSAVAASVAASIEAKCPMCRTQTSATLDGERDRQLAIKYQAEYAQRRAEDEAEKAMAVSGRRFNGTQAITLYIGNYHREVIPSSEDSHNTHEWTFFVRMSRTDIIEEVQLVLHPTFRPPRVIRTRPPYSIRRIGWGVFTITAYIILKAGYAWLSSEAENSPDSALNGMIGLPWTLDFEGFDGRGSMERMKLVVRRDGVGPGRGGRRRGKRDSTAEGGMGGEGMSDGENEDGGEDGGEDEDEDEDDDEELRRDRRAWDRMVREYQRDGRWEPDDDDE